MEHPINVDKNWSLLMTANLVWFSCTNTSVQVEHFHFEHMLWNLKTGGIHNFRRKTNHYKLFMRHSIKKRYFPWKSTIDLLSYIVIMFQIELNQIHE